MAVITGTNQADIINTISVSPGVVGGPATADADQIYGYNGDDQIYGGWGDDTLDGGNGNDLLVGGLVSMVVQRDNDLLIGGNGNDTLYGGPGDDTLDGGRGDDRLAGQEGSNILTGGPGADVFVFGHSIPHIYATLIGQDTITDFRHGEDHIDLTNLNYLGGTNDLAYTFIGQEPFSGRQPEVRYYNEGGRTVIELDTQFSPQSPVDGKADGTITLIGYHVLDANDFYL